MTKVFLWGSGNVAEKVIRNCRTLNQYDILGIIDNDVTKVNGFFMGYHVYGPEHLLEVEFDKIVILADCYSEIKQQILFALPSAELKIENKNFFFKESLIKRYANTSDLEIQELVGYIKENGLDYFNYDFKKKYDDIDIDVIWDDINSMYYLVHNGKKMYFPSKFADPYQIKAYYRSLLIEQDVESPHHYIDDGFDVQQNDIVIDVGAAEGLFSINVIDKASKIYLIEADDMWIDALKVTFAPYQEKVQIIEKYVSSYDDGSFAQLDTIIDNSPNFIKMDIEGNEWEALYGARRIIENSDNLKMAVCCYHSDFDQDLIERLMDELNIKHSTTCGYMWFPDLVRQNYVSCKLNRAIVRGMK